MILKQVLTISLWDGKMPNKAAKQRKQKRLMLNKKWAREGRTAKQHKKWLANGGGQVINKYGR